MNRQMMSAAVFMIAIGCSAANALTPGSFTVSISNQDNVTYVDVNSPNGGYHSAIFMDEAIADYFQTLSVGEHTCVGKVMTANGQIFDTPKCE